MIEDHDPGDEHLIQHEFKPGNPTYGHLYQCSVKVPCTEFGRVVLTHCGYSPDRHVSRSLEWRDGEI